MRAAVAWRGALGLLCAASLGCGTPPPAPVKLMEVELTGQAVGFTGAMDVTVQHLHAQQRPGGGWHVVAELSADYAGTHSFDGLHTQFHSTLVPRDRIKLVADGKEWPSVVDITLDNAIGDNLILPSEPPRRAQGRIAWDVDTPLLGDDLFVRLHAYEGVTDIRLRGKWRTADKQPAVAVQLIEPSGAVVAAPVVLSSGTTHVARSTPWNPWLLPARAGTWTVTGEGYAPIEVVIPDPPPAELSVTVSRTDAATRFDSQLVDAWGPASGDRRDDVLRVADGPVEADGVADWLEAHVGVLPTMSFQHGVGYAVRRGAAAPFERALLGRDLLRRLGRDARVACGDLEPDQAAVVYGPAPAPAIDPVLAAPVAALKADVDALTPAVSGTMAAWAERPLGSRSRYDVVPEWCWVESRMPTKSDDTPWQTTDLRPAAMRSTPLPTAWRTMTSLGDEVWWIAVSVGATYQHGVGEGSTFETVELVSNRTNAALLSETALLIDLFKAGEPGLMRSQIAVLSDDEVRGEEGKDFARAELVSVYLNITWTDPDHMGDASRTWDLWIPRPGEELTSYRLLLSADSGMVNAARVQERLSQAISGAHPAPGALALWSRHDLYGALRAQLTAGQLSAEPQILATSLRAFEDGRAWWTFDAYPSTLPAQTGASFDQGEVARWAAADAALRARILGVPVPAPPTEWVRSEADGGRIYQADAADQSSVIRGLTLYAYAVEPGGAWWQVDRVAGGLSWMDRRGAPASPPPQAPADVPAGDRIWPHLFWDRTVRCTEGTRWAALLGRPSPGDCATP